MPDIEEQRAPKDDMPKVEEAEKPSNAHENMLRETQAPAVDSPAAPKTPGADPSEQARFMSKQSLSNELMAEGVMPAMDSKDLPETLARAASLMNNKDLGVASDRGLSSGTAVSRLLMHAGENLQQTAFIPNLKAQLEKNGWTSQTFSGDKADLKPGDLVFTNTEQSQGRNVGIVGVDGKIYSHNFRTKTFQGHDNWTSKFVTVMRKNG